MPRRKKEDDDDFDLNKMLTNLAGQLSQSARKPNNNMYVPHDKQIIFHASTKKGRLYQGGNRSGKTTGGINEDIWWLRGQHPYQKVPEPPVIGRITTVDFKNGAEKIIIPNLRQWVPPSLLINGSWEDSYNAQKHILKCENGSELEIMSYDQELDKFAGVPRHFTHFDEECPQDIYQECLARLVDYNGHWWMTMTPVEGMTWTFEILYEPAVRGQNRLIDIINVDMHDNPHLSAEAIESLLEGYDDEQRQIRGSGSFVAIGGLVFKYFDHKQHIIEPVVPPNNWTFYQSLDHGFNNPTAWLWHAVSPDGVVITFDEHYKSEMTVEQHANFVKEKEKIYRETRGIVPFLRVADPAIKQRSAVTGYSIQIEYSLQGLDLALGQLRSVDAGLNRMNTYLQNNKWFITSNCTNLLKEMRKYKRKTYMSSKMKDRNNRYEEPMKKDDHAIDSARYFFSFMPELAPLTPGQKPSMDKEGIARMIGAGTTFNPARPIRLDYGTVSQPDQFIIDEFLGGEF